MANTRRVEYAARETRDFVVMLKKDCFKRGSMLTLLKMTSMAVIGHHFGAHVAYLTCKYLNQRYEEMDINLTGMAFGKKLFSLILIYQLRHFCHMRSKFLGISSKDSSLYI